MNKRIGYRDLYSMYKKAGIVDDLKAAAGNIGKEWNRNPYLRTGVGALTGAGLGGLVGGKTGAGIGAVLGGTGGYLAHGDEEVEPGFWDKYGTGLMTAGGIGVGSGATIALMRLAKANPRALRVLRVMVHNAGKAGRSYARSAGQGIAGMAQAVGGAARTAKNKVGDAIMDVRRAATGAKVKAQDIGRRAGDAWEAAKAAYQGKKPLRAKTRFQRLGKKAPYLGVSSSSYY